MSRTINTHSRSTLWDSTCRLAGDVAAVTAPSRRAAIVELLGRHEGGLAIFEIAQKLGCHDHQISGRFSKMVEDGILVTTGERRVKPRTKCQAEVYALCARCPS